MLKNRTSLTVGVVIAALTLGACASSGTSSSQGKVASLGDGATTTTATGANAKDFQASMLKFAACMRKNGVDMPDPQFDSNGRPQFGADRPGSNGGQSLRDDPDFEKAQTACRSLRESVQGSFELTPAQQAEMQKSILAYAKCMRSKGVDFPDPQFDANGRPQFGANTGRDAFDNLRSDPKFQAASETCRKAAGGTGPGRGFGFGGPPGGGPRGQRTGGTTAPTSS